MKSSRLFLAVGLCLVAGNTSARANEILRFDPSRSTIEFNVRHFFGTAKGKFTKFSGTIDVDREYPEKSTVTATIQTASIDTAIAKRDEHLRGEDFFNVGKYPEITFKSRRVKQTGPNNGEITGDFDDAWRDTDDHAPRPAAWSGGKSDKPLAYHNGAAQTR